MATTIGRPLEFDPDSALEAAMQLFWRQGYEHTSMQDLLSAMNLSKSSLYQAFGGKQRLFRQCLARYTDRLADQLREGLAGAVTGRRFIEDFLDSVLADVEGDAAGDVQRRGCLVMNTASEFAQSEADIARDVASSIERFRDVLQAAVQRAQREGDIPPERDARQLANFLVSSMSGLKNLAKAGADAQTLKGIIAMILKALD
ncbi:MAG: TetR/AcrR family transcriptional regulator [Anaerolineae bacterium]